jgi:hypothetical protein
LRERLSEHFYCIQNDQQFHPCSSIHFESNTFLYVIALQKHMVIEAAATATVVFNFESTQTDTSTKDTEEKLFRERYTLEL